MMRFILLLPATAALAAAAVPSHAPSPIPVVFEKNSGQVDAQVRFFGRANGARLWLVDKGAVFSVQRAEETAVVRMNLKGARAHPQIEGAELLPAKANYFMGNDPHQWRRDVAQYGAVRYRDAYPGIDLLFHASDRTIEYDWIVAPGADPRQIHMSFEGADQIRIDSSGDLVLKIGDVEVREKRPHLYQENGDVQGRFVLRGTTVSFDVAGYDHARTLTIDPILTYATNIGGSGNKADQEGDYAGAVVIDSQGNYIVAGTTYSTNFPTQSGLYTSKADSAIISAFIAKINPSAANAASLVWSTYLGGSVQTQAYSVALDSQNNVYVTGITFAPNFPVEGQFQSAPPALCSGILCQQAFVTKISSAGNQLMYSSYLGGSNKANAGFGIAVTSSGAAWVTGYTQASDFPTTNNAAQIASGGGVDGFVTLVNPSGSQLTYSSYLGGSGTDELFAITVNSAGNAFVTGGTQSPNYPTVNAYQGSDPAPDKACGVITEINPSATSPVVYSTYLGGTTYGSEFFGITLDGQGDIYVAGETESPAFPTTANAVQNASDFVQLEGMGHGLAGIISELNPSAQPAAQLVYSTYLTGGVSDEVANIALDGTGRIVAAGNTESPAFPTTPDAFQSLYPGNVSQGQSVNKAFLAIVNPAQAGMNGLAYSTLYGGSSGDILQAMAVSTQPLTAVLVGAAYSTDLFITPNAYQAGLSSPYGDAYVASFNLAQAGPTIGAMTNGASFVPNRTTFAPGEVVTLFVPQATLPTSTALGPQTIVTAELNTEGLLSNTLANCQFLVNGTPSPLVYVQAGQSTAILPYELTPLIGKNQVSYGQMVCNNVPGNVFQFTVVAADPGVFVAGGTAQIAALNQDGTYNSASNPASGGSIVTLFESGEGVLTPAGEDGRIETGPLSSIPVPSLPVAVLFGTTASPMLTYAAVAPAEVDGLLQIDAQVPSGLTAGSVPITVMIGKYSSQTGVTIAVH